MIEIYSQYSRLEQRLVHAVKWMSHHSKRSVSSRSTWLVKLAGVFRGSVLWTRSSESPSFSAFCSKVSSSTISSSVVALLAWLTGVCQQSKKQGTKTSPPRRLKTITPPTNLPWLDGPIDDKKQHNHQNLEETQDQQGQPCSSASSQVRCVSYR